MFSPVSLYDGLFLNFLYRLFSIFSVLKENYRTKGSYPGFGSCFYRQRKHGQIELPLLGPEHFGFPVSEGYRQLDSIPVQDAVNSVNFT